MESDNAANFKLNSNSYMALLMHEQMQPKVLQSRKAKRNCQARSVTPSGWTLRQIKRFHQSTCFIDAGQEEKKFILDSGLPPHPYNVLKASDKRGTSTDSRRVRAGGSRGRSQWPEMNINRWNKSPPNHLIRILAEILILQGPRGGFLNMILFLLVIIL